MKVFFLLFLFAGIANISIGQTSFTNLQFLTGATASGEVLNTAGTIVLSGGTPNQFNTMNDLTAAKLLVDNADLKDFILSETSTAGALGSATVTLNPSGALARIRNNHSYGGVVASNNPGSITANTFELRFNSNLNVTDASFDFNSLNTAGIAWEYTVIQLLDANGNPFNPVTSPGWTIGANSQYGTGPVAGFSGQAGIGNYIAASKATVTGVGTANTTGGASGANNDMSTFDFTTVGLAAGTRIGGIRWTTYLEDVRGTLDGSTNFTSSLVDFIISGTIAVVLPVSLYGFSGYKAGSVNKVQWMTASEQNNLGFEVQRSTDGVNFIGIGFVNSKANQMNSSAVLSYNYTDDRPAPGRQYYRLCQKDIDNQKSFSTIILVSGEKPLKSAITGLFPNPSISVLNVGINMPANDNISLSVFDKKGQPVLYKTVGAGEGANTVQLDISKLPAGIYMIRMICNNTNEVSSGTFVKQ